MKEKDKWSKRLFYRSAFYDIAYIVMFTIVSLIVGVENTVEKGTMLRVFAFFISISGLLIATRVLEGEGLLSKELWKSGFTAVFLLLWAICSLSPIVFFLAIAAATLKVAQAMIWNIGFALCHIFLAWLFYKSED